MMQALLEDRLRLGPVSAVDAAAPPIFRALREQLGLQLESAKDPVVILVIDHVEKPPTN